MGSWDIVAYGWSTSKVNGPHSCSLVGWKRTIVGLDSTKNSARRPCCSWSFQKCGEEQTALQRWNHSPCSVTEDLIRDYYNLLVMKWAFTAVHWGLAVSFGPRGVFQDISGATSIAVLQWCGIHFILTTILKSSCHWGRNGWPQQRFNELIQFLGGVTFFENFELCKLDAHTQRCVEKLSPHTTQVQHIYMVWYWYIVHILPICIL